MSMWLCQLLVVTMWLCQKAAVKNEMQGIPVTMIASTVENLPNTRLPAVIKLPDVTSNTSDKLSADFSLLPINKESNNK